VVVGAVQRLVARGFGYRDIAILLRNRNSLSQIERALTRYEIPYCLLGGIGFWDRQEVMDILALYRLVFYPDDKLALFTVLRSPVFGFSDNLVLEFAEFMKKQQQQYRLGYIKLGYIMEGFCQTIQDNESWIVQRATCIFKELGALSGVLNAVELFDRIVELTAYDEVLTALPYGEKKLRNLEKLAGIVEEFEKKGIYSARELLGYIDALKKSSGRDEEAALDSEDSDAVKILTIHAAKGLEFKAVLVPDMHGALDSQAKKHKPLFLLDEQNRLAAMGVDENGGLSETANPAYDRLYNQRLAAELDESKRLFYVAATRAQEYLGLIGQRQDVGEVDQPRKLNTFMKQLVWAIEKSGGIVELAEVDAKDLLPHEGKQGDCSLVAVQNMKRLVHDRESVLKSHDADDVFALRLKPCSGIKQGSISISSWMKYRDCPRRFYIESILGFRVGKDILSLEISSEKEVEGWNFKSDPAGLGTNLHLLLKEMGTHSLHQFNLEALAEFAEDLSIDISPDDMALYKRCIQGFLNIENERTKADRAELVECFKEYAFRVPIAEGLYLTGIVDRVDVYRKGGQLRATVIDYKTNRVNSRAEAQEVARYYQDQLICYAWALNKALYCKGERAAVDEAVVYFLNNGLAVSVELDEGQMMRLIDQLVGSAPALLGSKPFDEYPPSKAGACTWCAVKRFCS